MKTRQDLEADRKLAWLKAQRARLRHKPKPRPIARARRTVAQNNQLRSLNVLVKELERDKKDHHLGGRGRALMLQSSHRILAKIEGKTSVSGLERGIGGSCSSRGAADG